MRDVRTVLWKEWQETFFRQSRPSGNFLAGLSFVAFFGVVVPTVLGVIFPAKARALIGANAVDQALLFMPMVSGLAVLAVVADVVAGERERHTLETLLASPIHDLDLLFGKMASVTLYAWILGILVGPTGIITLLILYGPNRIDVPNAWLFTLMILISLLVSILMTTLGVLASVYSRTVRQGQQYATLLMMPFLVFLPMMLVVAQQQWFIRFVQPFRDIAPNLDVVAAGTFLLGLDLVLLYFAMRVFQRPRLLRA